MSWWKAIAPLVLAAGCDNTLDCTNADCLDSFSLVAGTAGGMALPAGRYEIELALDGMLVTCQANLPQEAPFSCTAADVSLGTLTARLTPDVATTFLMQTTLTPRTVDAVVRHEGRELARASLEPMYSEFAPNGVECGPVCMSSRVYLPLTF